MRAQLGYALPLGAAAILSMAQLDLHNYFVARSFDAATFAIYAVGCFQLPCLQIVAASVGGGMIPAVGRLQLEGERREIVELLARMVRMLAALYFPLYACLLVVGREFVTVLFTESYRGSWPIFAVNLTLIPLGILTSACDPVLRAYPAYTSILVRIRVALVAVLVLGLWSVTARHWLLGAIVVMVSVNAVDRVAVSLMLARVLKVTGRDLARFGDVAKLAAAAAVAGVIAAVVRLLVGAGGALVVLAASGAAFATVYVVSVWALGGVTVAERDALRRRALAFLGRLGTWRRGASASGSCSTITAARPRTTSSAGAPSCIPGSRSPTRSSCPPSTSGRYSSDTATRRAPCRTWWTRRDSAIGTGCRRTRAFSRRATSIRTIASTSRSRRSRS